MTVKLTYGTRSVGVADIREVIKDNNENIKELVSMVSRSKEKIYKKGTIVRLFCCTHDVQSEEQDDYTLESDMTAEQLCEMAKDFFYNCKEPEWWFEELEGVESEIE